MTHDPGCGARTDIGGAVGCQGGPMVVLLVVLLRLVAGLVVVGLVVVVLDSGGIVVALEY